MAVHLFGKCKSGNPTTGFEVPRFVCAHYRFRGADVPYSRSALPLLRCRGSIGGPPCAEQCRAQSETPAAAPALPRTDLHGLVHQSLALHPVDALPVGPAHGARYLESRMGNHDRPWSFWCLDTRRKDLQDLSSCRTSRQAHTAMTRRRRDCGVARGRVLRCRAMRHMLIHVKFMKR